MHQPDPKTSKLTLDTCHDAENEQRLTSTTLASFSEVERHLFLQVLPPIGKGKKFVNDKVLFTDHVLNAKVYDQFVLTQLSTRNPGVSTPSFIAVSFDVLVELQEALLAIQIKAREVLLKLNKEEQAELQQLEKRVVNFLKKLDLIPFANSVQASPDQAYFFPDPKHKVATYSTFDFADICQGNPLLEQVVEVVLSQIESRNLRPNEICRCLGVSRSQLYRKMKERTDISVARFIRLIRLRVAKKYLCNTSMRVSEVAYKVGFNSASYFSRAFIHEFGMSPKAARQ